LTAILLGSQPKNIIFQKGPKTHQKVILNPMGKHSHYQSHVIAGNPPPHTPWKAEAWANAEPPGTMLATSKDNKELL
jgi:hypothetical protein